MVSIVCTPPFRKGGGVVEFPTKLSKRAELDRTSTFRGGDFFQGGGGCNCHIKNKLKSKIFNDKKSLLAKNIFLCH